MYLVETLSEEKIGELPSKISTPEVSTPVQPIVPVEEKPQIAAEIPKPKDVIEKSPEPVEEPPVPTKAIVPPEVQIPQSN